MLRILISLRDPVETDVVKTAFKQFSGMATYPVPSSRLSEVIPNGSYDAVILELNKGEESKPGLVAAIRKMSSKIEIIALVDQDLKERFNRFKVTHNIFTLCPRPIDAFDLARRIARLEKSLIKSKSPARV